VQLPEEEDICFFRFLEDILVRRLSTVCMEYSIGGLFLRAERSENGKKGEAKYENSHGLVFLQR
jgi:hypothetical protein